MINSGTTCNTAADFQLLNDLLSQLEQLPEYRELIRQTRLHRRNKGRMDWSIVVTVNAFYTMRVL